MAQLAIFVPIFVKKRLTKSEKKTFNPITDRGGHK